MKIKTVNLQGVVQGYTVFLKGGQVIYYQVSDS